jgi:predicted RNase H-like nuclease (RuvC/YqgF family)
MSMVAKILIVLNLILAVAVMGAAGAYLQSAENWKNTPEANDSKLKAEIVTLNDRVKKEQESRDEANRGKAAAMQAQSAAEAQVRTLQDNNSVLVKQINDITASLEGINQKMKDLQGNLDAARTANEKLTGEKSQAEADKRAALDAQAKAETEQKRLSNEVASLTSSLDATQKDKVMLADNLEAANTHLEMYKKKFGPLSGETTPVKGQILAADSAMDIYLISVGTKDGVKIADELTVFRGDAFVAVVVVDQVFDNKASVVVKKLAGKPMKKGDIKTGDKVATVF